MVKHRPQALPTALLLAFIAHTVALIFGGPWLVILTKSLLMPALLWSAMRVSRRVNVLWLAAIAFSWIGDVLLSFPEVFGQSFGELYFLGGLTAFLVTHGCYVFLAIQRGGRLSPKTAVAIAVAIAIAQTATRSVNLLLTTGIYLYAFTLLSLVAIVYSTYVKTDLVPDTGKSDVQPKPVDFLSAKLTFFGALLFALSDLLIAGQKFGPLPENSLGLRLAIMSLYIIGQWWLSSLRHSTDQLPLKPNSEHSTSIT